MIIMDWIRKVTDIIMPMEPIEEEEELEGGKKTETKTAEQTQAQTQNQAQAQVTQAQPLVEQMNARRTATGGGAATATATSAGVSYNSTARPNLKILKAPEFVMKVYQPADYSQINGIADDILAKKAAVVNYEYVRPEEQRRICDYIEGVCYAVDGTSQKISEKIFLYVPEGISASDIEALVASVRYH